MGDEASGDRQPMRPPVWAAPSLAVIAIAVIGQTAGARVAAAVIAVVATATATIAFRIALRDSRWAPLAPWIAALLGAAILAGLWLQAELGRHGSHKKSHDLRISSSRFERRGYPEATSTGMATSPRRD